MEPYQIILLIIIGIAFSIFVYYWGKQTGRMQMINELSGDGGSKKNWDGRFARRKMFLAIWDGIRSRYTEENLPTGLATFFRETVSTLLTLNFVTISLEQLKSIANNEIDDLSKEE